MENVIIIGTGCAGYTAAIYAARANLQPLIISGNQPGGQLTTTSEVENFPGFTEGIDGFTLMENLRKQAERFGARTISDQVDMIDVSDSCITLFSGNKTHKTRSVIIATGASPRLLGIPGEQEMYGGKGVTTCATCDGAFYRNKDVVVIGGGDSACEEALFLTRFCGKVTMIVRRDQFRASEIMGKRAKEHPKIKIIWNHIPEKIIPDYNGVATAIEIRDRLSGTLSQVPCKGVFIAIGHIPNTKFVSDLLDVDSEGYLVPISDSNVLTKLPGIFIAGDCADKIYRQAITAAGMGCQAAIEAERWLAEN